MSLDFEGEKPRPQQKEKKRKEGCFLKNGFAGDATWECKSTTLYIHMEYRFFTTVLGLEARAISR
jgi:hypothetical protein